MNCKKLYTIIIPVWPNEERPFGLDYIKKLYFETRYEVIFARGLSPCHQRNQAAHSTEGEILIFFDNDSCPEPDYLQKLDFYFEDAKVAGVGGPNPGLPTERFIPNLVEAVFTNPFAIGRKYSRYKPIGSVRDGGDSDFIFCNFAMRKEIYLALNGLDERLCPNEENEFFERFFRQYPDKKLLYVPNLIAYEPRPDTIRAFLKKMCGYGRGRARQFRVRPTIRSLAHVMGAIGAFILPVLLFLVWSFEGLLLLTVPYVLLLFTATLYSLMTFKIKAISFMVVPAIIAVHFSYAAGICKGLVEPLKKKDPDSEIKIDFISI
jgi:cellulose synthase/poly-beta-1,6-N-acetylglucosamine synthase-like glycosyltransferase